MRPTILVRSVILGSLLAVLVGCRAGYEVDVRNLTDQPITARLTVPHTDGAPQTLQEHYVGIGDRKTMFTQQDASKPVALSVDFQGNVGYPAVLDLSRGQTIVNVRRSDEGGRGRIQIEAVPRP
jgi:hypothetical protein